ncbi:MAG: zinc ribbon domain-containing protein [Tissierellales bacterium]
MGNALSVGIKSFGAYIPRRRMARAAIAEAHAWALPSLKGLGKGEKSFCNWDEDAITLAVEAARDCIKGYDRQTLVALDFASTTPPFADLQNAVVVGSALSLCESIRCSDFGGSTRAGTTALVRALEAGGQGDRLVVAAEKRVAKPGSAQEMQYGSGAGALLVGEGEDLIARLVASETISKPFVDHFRSVGEKYNYHWEERWVRDEGMAKIVPQGFSKILDACDRSADDVAWLGISGGPAGSDGFVAKKLGIAADRLLPNFQGQVGDTGAAQSILQLIDALEKAQPGDLIVIISFANGCEVAAFEMLRRPADTGRRGLAGTLARGITETAYLKMLSNDGAIDIDWGMRAEADKKSILTEMYRGADQFFGFVGGKCDSCGTVQFPRAPSCVNCGSYHSLEPFALSEEKAKVATYTVDWLMYTPAPPLYVGLMQFDNGARVLMEVCDVGTLDIETGMEVEMAFRIKERDTLRHLDRYFWKATPSI